MEHQKQKTYLTSSPANSNIFVIFTVASFSERSFFDKLVLAAASVEVLRISAKTRVLESRDTYLLTEATYRLYIMNIA